MQSWASSWFSLAVECLSPELVIGDGKMRWYWLGDFCFLILWCCGTLFPASEHISGINFRVDRTSDDGRGAPTNHWMASICYLFRCWKHGSRSENVKASRRWVLTCLGSPKLEGGHTTVLCPRPPAMKPCTGLQSWHEILVWCQSKSWSWLWNPKLPITNPWKIVHHFSAHFFLWPLLCRAPDSSSHAAQSKQCAERWTKN